MTSIKLIVTGAKARAMVDGLLTAGMVGIPVTIEYDGTWDGLTKNLVCRSGQWYGPSGGETRTILNVGSVTTVAHEVMTCDKNLYLGIEGYNADGTLVIPTIWADCGKIHPGARSNADTSAKPTLPIWAQLQAKMEELKQNCVTEAKIAAVVADYLEENPIEIPDSSQNANQGWTTGQIDLLDQLFNYIPWTSSEAGTIARPAIGESGTWTSFLIGECASDDPTILYNATLHDHTAGSNVPAKSFEYTVHAGRRLVVACYGHLIWSLGGVITATK